MTTSRECGLEINKQKSSIIILNKKEKPQEIAGITVNNNIKYLAITINDDKNILDLVFMNNETLVSQIEIGVRFDVSDHHEIRFKINAKREVEQNTALVPDFRKANYQASDATCRI